MLMGVFGAILPRFVLLVGWVNDPNAWTSLFGAPVWFLFGFLFFPWTTLVYGFVALNGMSFINWIFVAAALLIDLGTWGIGAFATRQQVSSYSGTEAFVTFTSTSNFGILGSMSLPTTPRLLR